MDGYTTLDLQQDGELLTVSLNRPPLNLFNGLMMEELTRVFHALRTDRSVRFLILAAAGKDFSGGADLREIVERFDGGGWSPAEARYQQLAGHELMRSLEGLEQVTVAALQGAVIGAGMAVAMACDFRIMAEGSFFSVPESMVGVYFTWGCTPRLVRMVGASRAMEIVMTCDPIPAHEALRLNLANKVVAGESLMTAARQFIDKIASRSPTAVRLTKKIALAAAMQGLGNTFVCEPELMEGLAFTGETEEGIRAFMEKRRPRY
jgi:enoyl-CoA hydratase/carnithine racemase